MVLLGLFNDEVYYRSKPSVKEFYAEELFTEIKEHIGRPVEEYRVASVGLHPAIAQYNGFYTWIRIIIFIRYHTNMNLEKLLAKNWKKIRQSAFTLMNGVDVVICLPMS